MKMMKIKKILFYVIPILMGGCIPIMSINPFYTDSDVVFEQKLVGTWVDDINEPKSTWQFAHADDPNDNSYIMTFFDQEGEKGIFTAHLFKLKDKIFLDIYPFELESESDANDHIFPYMYNLFFMVPTHTIFKVESIQEELRLAITEEDKIRELLDEHPDSIENSVVEGRTVLTSKTEKIQEFILKYSEDERLFSDEIQLVRKEK